MKLKDLSRNLTQEQKAKAFELMLEGNATGMSLFWEEFDRLKNIPHDEILREMYKLACTEALEIVFELR